MNDLFRGGRLSHAYVFRGKAAPQTSLLAAQTLLCQSQSACGECRACRMFAQGTHPDYLPLDDEKSIRIDALRDVLKNVGSAARMGGRRVVHIINAPRLTVQSQNALLKTLEDPPQNVVFLLCGDAGLLSTILSRCLLVRCDGQAQALRAHLERSGADPEAAQLYAAIAEAPIEAEALLGEATRALRENALQAALTLYESPEAAAGRYGALENPALALSFSASFFADAASLANGGPIRNTDARALLERCSNPVRALSLHRLCTDAVERLSRNAAAHLTISRLSILAKRTP